MVDYTLPVRQSATCSFLDSLLDAVLAQLYLINARIWSMFYGCRVPKQAYSIVATHIDQ